MDLSAIQLTAGNLLATCDRCLLSFFLPNQQNAGCTISLRFS